MPQTIPGRNEPCHCGSGKKYKKCCLAKDEEAKQAKKAEPVAASADWAPAKEDKPQKPEPDPQPDPHIEAFNARLRDFEAADYEGKFYIFNRTLDEPELMDGEMAFEMLHDLFRHTIERGERNRFDELVKRLRERLPETYAAETSYFLHWRIANALVDARSEDVSVLFHEMALPAGKNMDIDIFNRAEEMIAYHGQLPALVDSMRVAWLSVKSSSNVVPWGIDEFCSRAMSYEILNFADRSPEAAVPSAELWERLAFYSEINRSLIAANLAHLTKGNGQQWTMNDFVLSPPHGNSEEEDEWEAIDEDTIQASGELNFYHLTIEFLGYLRRVEGVSYAKGELGRRELYQFILDRHAGKLEYRQSMLQSMLQDVDSKKGRRAAPQRKYRRYEHMLVPDPERLEHFLADLLGMMNQLNHRASAFFEIIPAWLRFLEIQQLIDAETRAQSIGRLAHLADTLGGLFDKYIDDPGPRQAMHGWREQAGI
jgi:hypothetical protein